MATIVTLEEAFHPASVFKFKIIADLNDYQKLAIRREGRYYHFVTSQRDYNLGQYKIKDETTNT